MALCAAITVTTTRQRVAGSVATILNPSMQPFVAPATGGLRSAASYSIEQFSVKALHWCTYNTKNGRSPRLFFCPGRPGPGREVYPSFNACPAPAVQPAGALLPSDAPQTHTFGLLHQHWAVVASHSSSILRAATCDSCCADGGEGDEIPRPNHPNWAAHQQVLGRRDGDGRSCDPSPIQCE